MQELVVNESFVDPIKRTGLGLLPYGSFKQPKHKKASSSQRPSNQSSAHVTQFNEEASTGLSVHDHPVINLKKTVVKTLKKDASTGAYSDQKVQKVAQGTQKSSKSNSATTSDQIVDQLEELLESATEQDRPRNGGC